MGRQLSNIKTSFSGFGIKVIKLWHKEGGSSSLFILSMKVQAPELPEQCLGYHTLFDQHLQLT